MHRRIASLTLPAAVLLATGAALAEDGSSGRSVPAVPAPAPSNGSPWMGVSMDNGGDTGVRVEHVVRGSPAERGGVRSGDRIVAVDGARVTAPSHVTRGVGAHKVGETVTLAV